MKFIELFEAKNIGDLYHLVTLNSMKFIIENNKLKFHMHYEPDEKYEYISLTRNKYMNNINFVKGFKLFRLIIDGNKLSERYKIKPFSYSTEEEPEYEERVITSEIKDIFKYVKGVVIIINKELQARQKTFKSKGIENLEELKKYCSEKAHRESLYKYYTDIADILEYLEKKNIPLYVQNGNNISRDLKILDNYLFV